MAEQSESQKRTAWILIGAMAGILLASLDSNIVSTAMPKIIGSLNGTAHYTWPVTAYLLAMTISMPLVGKLSDVYGYKPIYFFGIVAFLAGSVLCGVSQSMAQFIVFRGLQGIGGGGSDLQYHGDHRDSVSACRPGEIREHRIGGCRSRQSGRAGPGRFDHRPAELAVGT